MVHVSWLDRPADYLPVWQAMRNYTSRRNEESPDIIWLVEHAPVYTLGQAGKTEHVLNPGSIPLVHCDRGGQVTYHGPGQVVVYPLIDLRRYKLFVRDYVQLLEDVALHVLGRLGVQGACRKPGAPGVYVPQAGRDDLAKIAALGVKIRNGCSYHGLSMNVAMDLSPFQGINPCGYEGLVTTDLLSCGVNASVINVGERLAAQLRKRLLERG